jgi:hypothetical protein
MKVAHRKPIYQLGPRTGVALSSLRSRRPRSLAQCERALRAIGQWSVDHGTDGIVTEEQIRDVDYTSAWRVMSRYVRLLLAVDALIEIAPQKYRLAHFFECNPPEVVRERRRELVREQTRLRQRRFRLSTRQKLEGSKPKKSATYDACNAELTDLRYGSPSSQKTRTNPNHIGETPPNANNVPSTVKTVGSPKKFSVVTQAEEAFDAVAAVRRLMQASASRSDAAYSIDFSSLAEQPQNKSSDQRATKKQLRVCRCENHPQPARMPRAETSLNEGHVTAALRDLGWDVGQASDLFGTLYRLGASKEDLGYAVHALQNKPAANRRAIRHPLRYIRACVANQRSWRSCPLLQQSAESAYYG